MPIQRKPNLVVTKDFLDKHPECIFVFGDNLKKKGLGGAAVLRYHSQAYGFITKKAPDNQDKSFYRLTDYPKVFEKELAKLKNLMWLELSTDTKQNTKFLISRLGGGLANKYNIFEKIVKPAFEKFAENKSHIILLW